MSTDDTIPPQEVGSDLEKWFKARLGKVTASRVKDVIAKTKTGPSTSRRKYMIELIAERLTGMRTDQFLNAAMLWGVESETPARLAYEKVTDYKTETVWFVDHPRIPQSGASPDALVGDTGLCEIKCPNTATHINTLLDKKINPDHITQMQWQMAATDRAWCDYVSFDSRLPVPYRLFIQRVERDPVAIAEMEKTVTEFLAEMDAAIAGLSA